MLSTAIFSKDCKDSVISDDFLKISKSFKNFCEDIENLNHTEIESERILKLSKIDKFGYVKEFMTKVPRETVADILARLKTVLNEYQPSIERRRKILAPLEEKVIVLRNEISNLENAKEAIPILEAFLDNKLCDDFFEEGVTRGTEICKNGKWLSTLKAN